MDGCCLASTQVLELSETRVSSARASHAMSLVSSDGQAVPVQPLRPDDFVRAMAQHVSSVCIITTQVRGERFGLKATAVSSVCTSPPRLPVCVNKAGATHEVIREAGHFCVNVLAEDQDHLAKVFAGRAGKSANRFDSGAWLCGSVLGNVGMALHHKLCHTLGGSRVGTML